jgi:8-oxo-dGTP diphosphatase
MEKPGVGVGVLVIREGKVLFGWRKSSPCSGTWCPPGGHLEFGESIEDCARREVMEETGIKIKNVRFGTVTNDIFDGRKEHYITVNMIADWDSGEPFVKEREKAEKWEWFSWDNLPNPLFLPVENMLIQGFRPE